MHLSIERFNLKSQLRAIVYGSTTISGCFNLLQFGQRLKTIYLVITLSIAAILFTTAAHGANNTIVVLGDSISAAYGVPTEKGWVSLFENRLKQENKSYNVINASISGETTDGGVKRLPEIIRRHNPSILLIELGGNDGLRGFPLNIIKANLQTLIDQAKENNITPVLIAMRIPPNYGRRYTSGFFDIFTTVAEENNVSLVPFLLEDIALKPGLMQSDGIHPTESAQPILLDHIWETLTPLL
ncbi:arylesterase [Alkalimarinus coralli]|uniref:arylesterase n=1 Tax=Alkalimarinus coralli TaxID=2935863 RepID=UPI00202B314F|nr:arylesterase [Alkalimarinus coralli]